MRRFPFHPSQRITQVSSSLQSSAPLTIAMVAWQCGFCAPSKQSQISADWFKLLPKSKVVASGFLGIFVARPLLSTSAAPVAECRLPDGTVSLSGWLEVDGARERGLAIGAVR